MLKIKSLAVWTSKAVWSPKSPCSSSTSSDTWDDSWSRVAPDRKSTSDSFLAGAGERGATALMRDSMATTLTGKDQKESFKSDSGYDHQKKSRIIRLCWSILAEQMISIYYISIYCYMLYMIQQCFDKKHVGQPDSNKYTNLTWQGKHLAATCKQLWGKF